jgi:hypothetical protein
MGGGHAALLVLMVDDAYGALAFLCLCAPLPFAYMYMLLCCVTATYPGAHWLRTFCCCGSAPHRSRHNDASGLQEP